MITLTKKQIRLFVEAGVAMDLTYAEQGISKEITDKEGSYTYIAFSHGTYGCNGMMIRGKKTGMLYAVTGRTPALFEL